MLDVQSQHNEIATVILPILLLKKKERLNNFSNAKI